MEPVEQVKQSFYVAKPTDKYKMLQRPIGVNADVSRITTRIVDPSAGVTAETLNNVKTLVGKKLDFDFGVSPGMLIDWDKSALECELYIANADGDGAASGTNNLLQWNALLTMFSEIHLQINGTNVFDKVADEYCPTQTLKWLVEYSREELESSQAVFAPIFDEFYVSDGVASPTYGITNGANMLLRNTNWITTTYTDTVKKYPTLKDLFFSIPGYSNNLKTVKLSFTLKSSIPISDVNTSGDGKIHPNNFRIHLHEVQPAPGSMDILLADKKASVDEHLAFIDVESRLLTYSSNMVVNNQQNVQYICVTQFGGDFTNVHGTDSATLSNQGQLQLFNGYCNNTSAWNAGTLLYRSDRGSTTACNSPPSSVQIQYGSEMYPLNAIQLRNKTTTTLEANELYQEYLRTVGKSSPAIKEAEFKRTLPMVLVKTHPIPKLMQSADIVVRMPGFDIANNTGTQYARVLWGKLKSFNIASSNVVSEAISTF